ncbi:MAG: glucosaminidase domain-containing protein [Bacteroidetes bacterium]|nr:glucosaminidase domain-containing protein [Bacteroidota bacterium]
MKKIAIAIVGILIVQVLQAQKMSVQEYIDKYKDLAIEEMQRSGVPASITLAQGILETENGNSDLVKMSNNHFGIKCKSNWTGASVTHTDDAPNECFRKYNSALDSYRDHSDYLKNTPRYAFLFKLNPSDYKGWAYGLKQAGYATNPKYSQILINNIEQYNLQQYNSASIDNNNIAEAGVQIKKEETAPAITNDNIATPTVATVIPVKKTRTLFNSLKAFYATKNTSLLAIATGYDIPLAKLLEFNDLKTDGLLSESQWIYLEQKPKQGNRDFYIALQTETLYSISQTNAVQLQSLVLYNQLPENETIKAGRRIRLRPVTAAAYTEPQKPVWHQVQPKEGLYSISKKYNVPVQDLKSWNNLDDDNLVIGQQLMISK